MSRTKQTFLWAGLLTLLLPLVGGAQNFGKNKVQYKSFDWSYLQTAHFDIYFYQGGEDLAQFVADYSEQAYREIQKDFRHELRKRVPIILYNSNNDFQQTNVILEMLGEGVGGFTEFFKHRVVMPHTGSFEEYRHVLHHELTHAVMMDMLYGGVMESLVRRQYFFVPPLWLAEGLSEFESLGWDKNSDMFMRDATISGYLQPLQNVGGYMAYKQGQSVIRYIANRYGGQKLGEILSKAKLHRNMEKALQSSIGMGVEGLNEEWSKTLRQQYWPEIARRQEARELARQLTDHTEDGSNFNLRPAFSPQGDRLAYFSDRSDYTDIYLISAIDGQVLDRLVKGERSGGLESLRYFRSSITWSPDGSQIAFVAKSGGSDALYLLSVEDKKVVKKYRFPLDLITSPAWSPRGAQIVFNGLKNGYSDLYLLSIETGELTRLTEDLYDDAESAWSPQGDRIAFASDRPPAAGEQTDTTFTYGEYDIYILDLSTGDIQPVVQAEGQQRSPTWSPQGGSLCYTSDENGISNLYVVDLESAHKYAITDVIGGCFSPCWSTDGKRLAFSYFQKGGWDLYVIKDPLSRRVELGAVEPTPFAVDLRGQEEKALSVTDSLLAEETADSATSVYQLTELQKDSLLSQTKNDSLYPSSVDTTDVARGPHRYRVKFSPDVLSGSVGYDTYYGFRGESVLAISDLMGNHRFYLLTSLFYSLSESDFQLAYYYLPRRIDYGIGLFHLKNYFVDELDRLFADRLYGGFLSLSRPFNKFDRLDVGLLGLAIDREYYDPPFDDSVTKLYQLTGSLVHDTVLWGNTGPVNGSRMKLTTEYAPPISGNTKSYVTFMIDRRRYLDYRKRYNFVYRLAAGASLGQDPQKFYLGGTANWLWGDYFRGDQYYTVEDIYFATRVTPLRGYDYNEFRGTRFGLINLEFRYPFIDYLLVHWPLRFGISRVNGVLFFDMGSAWENTKAFKGGTTKGGNPRLKDLKTGFGFGTRANLGIFVLRFDVAWKNDFDQVSPKPKTYFSLGAEF